jgi:hypothetical protein
VTKNTLHRLKGFGYLTSSVSVFLFATMSWSSAHMTSLLTACLIVGVATSIIGMFFRRLTYEIEKRSERADRQGCNGSMPYRAHFPWK